MHNFVSSYLLACIYMRWDTHYVRRKEQSMYVTNIVLENLSSNLWASTRFAISRRRVSSICSWLCTVAHQLFWMFRNFARNYFRLIFGWAIYFPLKPVILAKLCHTRWKCTFKWWNQMHCGIEEWAFNLGFIWLEYGYLISSCLELFVVESSTWCAFIKY